MSTIENCPCCGSNELETFYEIEQVPVHSVLLLQSKEEAVNFRRGEIRLACCQQCGFITNTAFDPSLHEYSDKYEGTQAYSETFNVFHKHLAEELIDKYELKGKRIVEIGCGQGEFLKILCQIGGNQGLGIDPSYRGETDVQVGKGSIHFIPDFYREDVLKEPVDFIVCKMTLEHIHNVSQFIQTVSRSLENRRETIIYFQIPDVHRILEEVAFWDIYYEHCAYFGKGSLAYLFEKNGFEIIDLDRIYDNQYLTIEARPGQGQKYEKLQEEIDQIHHEVGQFIRDYPWRLAEWKAKITKANQAGRKIVVWGGGSKAVSFLTTLGIYDEIPCAVDINPLKNCTYLAGTGQQVVSPDQLRTIRPDLVIVMNPVYVEEIRSILASLDLHPEIVPLA